MNIILNKFIFKFYYFEIYDSSTNINFYLKNFKKFNLIIILKFNIFFVK